MDLLRRGAQKEGVSIHKYQLILRQFTWYKRERWLKLVQWHSLTAHCVPVLEKTLTAHSLRRADWGQLWLNSNPTKQADCYYSAVARGVVNGAAWETSHSVPILRESASQQCKWTLEMKTIKWVVRVVLVHLFIEFTLQFPLLGWKSLFFSSLARYTSFL